MGSSTAFVAGGSGVVGRPIVRALLAEERRVVALARSRASADELEKAGAEVVRGDVLDRGSLDRGVRGADVVYHVAGLNLMCPADPRDLYEVNVLGTRNVVLAAARAGVRRIVYTSSAATLGEEPGAVGSETTPHRGWFLSHYEHSKYEGECTALSAAAAEGVELVCVNPSSVQGPGRGGGTARILRAFLDGRLRFFVDSRLSLVDVRDTARGHLLAERLGLPGERYVLNGATLTTREALRIVASLGGVRKRPRSLPPRAAMTAAAGAEGVARLAGRTPPMCRELVRTLLHGHAYDGSRAERELGLAYTPVEDTLRAAIAWLASAGLLRRPPAWATGDALPPT